MVAIKTSLTKYTDDDPEGNPMLILYLANKNFESIKGIPGGYNVTIPVSSPKIILLGRYCSYIAHACRTFF